MAIKKFAMSTSVLMGENACEQIETQLSVFGAKKIMLATDAGIVKAGIVGRVLDNIKDKDTVVVFDEVQPDPTVKVVDRGGAIARSEKCDLIIAVGGGSSIDAAKGISVVATNPGSSADYEGLDKYTAAPLPIIAIPTTLGTGSEVTFGAVLTNSDTNYKFILYGYNLAPKVALLDPLLLKGIPKSIVIPTGMDALTHAIESYISKGATPQSRPLALEAIRIISRNIEKAASDPDDIEAISNMLYAANIAGIAFACSRLGIVHAMALPLGAFFHIPHGLANTILLPHGLEYNLGYDNKKYCDMAVAMGEDVSRMSEEEAAGKAVDCLKKLGARLGAPSSLSEMGVKEDTISAMARDTMKSSHIPVNPRPIKEEEVAELYRKAM